MVRRDFSTFPAYRIDAMSSNAALRRTEVKEQEPTRSAFLRSTSSYTPFLSAASSEDSGYGSEITYGRHSPPPEVEASSHSQIPRLRML